MSDDMLEQCTAPVLGNRSSAAAAVERAVELMTLVRSQGFEFPPGPYARFAKARHYASAEVLVPASVAAVEDVVPYLLNPDYCISEMIVFKLVKGEVGVECRIMNIRRSFPVGVGETIRIEERALNDRERREELVYDLEVSFANPRFVA